MSRVTVTRSIDAPVGRVFETVAKVEGFAEAVPDILEVEFLSDTKSGVGTRFRETRLMRGKKAATELEVTEYDEDQRVRLISDTGGTVWDSVFTVRPEGDGTLLELTMEARPYTLLARLTTPLFKGMITKALVADMDAVKAHCEG